ncbi:MAG: hypothetical protein JSW43_04720 [Gemmatimonadota bacterium]|nr:MAG: hypothetical protein JSW43_04720 [Gemmatimonadota bacterium]
MRDPGNFGLLDGVDLAIHEAGHVFFGLFGEFMGFLGGTLFQLLIPVTFLGYFLQRHNRFAAAVMLWWVAQNLWNISVYVKDARDMLLPLVGGGQHDWNYLLEAIGQLHRAQEIGQAVFVAGVLCAVVAVAWGLQQAWRPVWKQTL